MIAAGSSQDISWILWPLPLVTSDFQRRGFRGNGNVINVIKNANDRSLYHKCKGQYYSNLVPYIFQPQKHRQAITVSTLKPSEDNQYQE